MHAPRLISFVLAVPLLAAPWPASGQEAATTGRGASLVGRVIDTSDARIRGATVELIGVAEAVTDTDGVYRLYALPPGSFFLRIRQIGYLPAMRSVSLRAGEGTRLDVELTAASTQLERVVVSASRADRLGFDSRRQHSVGGVFVTEEQIARRAATATEQLFQDIPFLRVTDGGALVTSTSGRNANVGTGTPFPPAPPSRPQPRGPVPPATPTAGQCTTMSVFVNGTHVGDGFSINTLAPSSIAGIEVYRGPATTPPQFRSYATICGTVVIWTK